MTPATIRAVAMHEAGHAVVGLRKGRTVEHVSIEPIGERTGHVQFGPTPSIADLPTEAMLAAQRQRIVTRLVVAYAGPVAQRRFYPRSRIRQGARDDYATAEHEVQILAGSPDAERALLRFARLEARTSVEQDAIAIRAVGNALVDHRRLTGEYVCNMLNLADRQAAALTQAWIAEHGLPSIEEQDASRAVRVARSYTVQRRDIERAIADAMLRLIVTGNQQPLRYEDADEAVRHEAVTRGRDPDAASLKLRAMYGSHADALRWKPCQPISTTARH